MLERRRERRRRVCLEAQIACGLTGSVETVRVRNMTDAGVEIIGAGSRDRGMVIGLRMRRAEGAARRGRVSWSGENRFGVEFFDEESPCVGRARALRRLDEIVGEAGRRARPSNAGRRLSSSRP